MPYRRMTIRALMSPVLTVALLACTACAQTDVDIPIEPNNPALRPIDGGDDYYSRFVNPLPTSADFFPLGVWFTDTQSPEDIAVDRAIGVNTYVQLTSDSNLDLIRANGMFAITDTPDPRASAQLTADEVDMWAGAGDAEWTGRTPPDVPICNPEGEGCGYAVMAELRDRIPRQVMVYSNYGKGVTFWQSAEEAQRFVSDYQDLVSVDNYWFTDGNICRADEGGALKNNGTADLTRSDCRLAANYGLTTRHVRSLVQPRASMPVWNFVEVGQPFKEASDSDITGPNIRAAVWSSIINGARGIIYFVHSFGGPCQSYNVLRDHCGDAIRGDLAAVNQQVTRLAPVLNAPFVDGFVRSTGPVDHSTKWHDGHFYVFAGSTQTQPSAATFTVACEAPTTVEVIDENRTLPIENRIFRDDFADGDSIHLYRINGDRCGLS